jgi:hypothetical protein
MDRITQKRLNFKISRLPTVAKCNYSRQIVYRYTFCIDFISALEDDELFTVKIVFSVEIAFRSSENVNLHDLKAQ